MTREKPNCQSISNSYRWLRTADLIFCSPAERRKKDRKPELRMSPLQGRRQECFCCPQSDVRYARARSEYGAEKLQQYSKASGKIQQPAIKSDFSWH